MACDELQTWICRGMGWVRGKVEEVWGLSVLPADVLQHVLHQLQGEVGGPCPDVNGELLIVAANHLIIVIDRDVRAWPTADIVFEMTIWSSKPFL